MTDKLMQKSQISSDIFWRDRPWLHKLFSEKELKQLLTIQITEEQNQKEIEGLIKEIQALSL
jgi:hypothetical protein